MRPFLALPALILPLLVALVPPAAAQQPGEVRTRSRTQGVTPNTTGDATCDAAVNAWRACIAASPKPPVDRAQANTEVDKFVRDVVDATGPNREYLIRACGPTAAGYRTMIENGTCAANITGARDDQATRVGSPRDSTRLGPRQRN